MYTFKLGPELVWAAIVTIVGVLAAAVQGGPPTDIKTWAIALAAGIVRALLGLIISGVSPSATRQ